MIVIRAAQRREKRTLPAPKSSNGAPTFEDHLVPTLWRGNESM